MCSSYEERDGVAEPRVLYFEVHRQYIVGRADAWVLKDTCKWHASTHGIRISQCPRDANVAKRCKRSIAFS